MKQIPLRDFNGLKTIDVIKNVIERPAGGATIAAMRSGVRVLDAIEKIGAGKDRLLLEDADHGALVNALNSFTFGMVSKDLLTIIDDVLQAKEPAPMPEPATAPAEKAKAA